MMRSYVRGAWFTFYPSLLEPGTDWREGSLPASLRAWVTSFPCGSLFSSLDLSAEI
jgi:hypothetical protein